jgi:hypothetical protein
MDYLEFIERLRTAGWKDTCDAQHEGAKKLYEDLLTTNKEPVANIHCSDGVMCVCSRCHNSFEAWEDLGETKTDICRECDNEEKEHMLWERDEFGARG